MPSLAILLCLTAAGLSAETLQLAGKVLNLGGAGMPGAKVTLTTGEANVLKSTVSGTDGTYRFSGLAPGRYSVFAELPGYLPSAQRIVDVSEGSQNEANLTLVPGSTTSKVDGPMLSAAGVRGSIDAAGYSAPASLARHAALEAAGATPCMDDPVRAIETLTKEVERDAKAWRPRFDLGVAQLLAGRDAEAVETLFRAIELAPDEQAPHFVLAQAAERVTSRAAEVRSKLKWFMEKNLSNAEAHYWYAQTLGADGEQELRRAIELDVGLVRAHLSLAALLEQKGDFAGAIGAYKEAVRLDPQAHSTLYRLAQAYRRAGQMQLSSETMTLFTQRRQEAKPAAERCKPDPR